jgi:hypothetical protein
MGCIVADGEQLVVEVDENVDAKEEPHKTHDDGTAAAS